LKNSYPRDLSDKLFKSGYFSYLSFSENYVESLTIFIDNNIHSFPHKKTPIELAYLGSYYVFYRPNKRTTWYIFFEKSDNRVLITHITNNHLEDIKFLN
jgi:hypothetical protein